MSSLSPKPCRVAIVAAGIVSPLGFGLDETLESLRLGRDCVEPVRLFDASQCRSKIAGQLDDARLAEAAFGPGSSSLTPRRAGRMHRAGRIMIAVVRDALRRDSGFQPERMIVGTTSGGMSFGEAFYRSLESEAKQERARHSKRMRPLWLANYLPQKAVLDAQEALGLRVPCQILANACASGANAIGHAFELIRSGISKRVLAGGYDALSELVFVGFDSLQAATPEQCRPFDKGRSGLVLAEGAAVLALEEMESALHRGATVLGEITGYGISTDTFHLTQPNPSGIGPLLSMRRALCSSRVEPGGIDYINAHGTATPFNDATEGAAISQIFGPGHPPVSSTKSMMGHALGAAGAIEAVISVLALQHDFLPPNTHYREADPQWNLDIVANTPRFARVGRVLSNSFGFGGTNATLIVEKARPHLEPTVKTEAPRTPLRSSIHGMGWVTPLGAGLEDVWERLMAGERAAVTEMTSPLMNRKRFGVRVPAETVRWLERLPRVRRSSAITYLTVAAGVAALRDAGLLPGTLENGGLALPREVAERTAVVYAVSNGGVSYSRRFYEKVATGGAPAASPLLFPETVYNAAASHFAALLGIDTATYTLVGDWTVGLTAIGFATELLAANPD